MHKDGLRNIHPDAKIGENVVIEPFATIGADVEIGDNCWIGPYASVLDGTRMGPGCRVYQGAVVGATPQDLKFQGETTTLEIGRNVTIREFCTLSRGTRAAWKTIIGDNTLLMAYVHVAHDCVVGKNCVLANNVTLAGHIEVGDWAVLGGLVAVHQFVHIGKHVMVSGGTLVGKDIPPYVKVAREPASYVGVNSIGLKRRGFQSEQINRIQDMYRYLFVKGYNTTKALSVILSDIPESPERQELFDFMNHSNRGLIKGYRPINGLSL